VFLQKQKTTSTKALEEGGGGKGVGRGGGGDRGEGGGGGGEGKRAYQKGSQQPLGLTQMPSCEVSAVFSGPLMPPTARVGARPPPAPWASMRMEREAGLVVARQRRQLRPLWHVLLRQRHLL
jgi:hypothetical protein